MVDAEEDCMFFKVLLDDFSEKLRLSERLVRREKWRKLNLTTALGGKKKVWSVEIQEDSGGIFHLTGDGWRSFVQDHDLLFGYFLVFIYRANTSFYVVPFDPSGFRKSYKPIEGTTMDDVVISEEKKSEDDDKLKMKKKTVEKNLKMQKKPQFKISMKRSYLYRPNSNSNGGRLNFPTGFRDWNNLSSINEVTLTNNKGCRWPVTFRHYQQNKGLRSALTYGWTVFIRDNNLKEGDVCIFQLLSKEVNTACFLVTKEVEFSRRKDNSNGRNLSRKDNSIVQSGRNLSRPHFEVTITKNHLFGRKIQVHIPVRFGGLCHLHDKSKAMLKNSLNGKSWEVMVLKKQPAENHIYHRFTKGWKEFCLDNQLEEGDVCSFELISKEGAAELEMITLSFELISKIRFFKGRRHGMNRRRSPKQDASRLK